MKKGRPFVKDLIKLSEVPTLLTQLIGVTRKKETIYYWARKGKINRHGEMIKLKTYQRLGVYYTTEEAVKNFLLELG